MVDRREIIINKTFNLLLINGFDAVSITDIQKLTGFSRGLLYHYFKNKEDLFIQVTEKYFVEIFDFDVRKTIEYSVLDLLTFMCQRFDKIDKVISGLITVDDSFSKASMLNYHFLFYQVMQRDVEFRNRYRSTTEKELIAWEHAIANSISLKEIRQEVDVKLSAKQLFALTDGVWFQNIFSIGENNMVQNLERELRQYIKLLQ